MPSKTKVREITFVQESGAFNAFFKKLAGEKGEYDFEGIGTLRRLLSNEKARLLHVIKTKKPNSIYSLAKLLGRNFKSVSEDIKLLERFGFIEMVAEKTGKRKRLRPVIVSEKIQINVKL